MGGFTGRGRYVHVFLNGLYWGLYYLHERPDDDWGAATFGGYSEEYDWVKLGAVMKGNSNPVNSPYGPGAWSTAMTIAWLGLDNDTTLPTGEKSYEVLQKFIDIPKYCDYLLVQYYICNTDWPHHNWMATSHARIGPKTTDVNPEPKFLYHVWDAEDSLPLTDLAVYGVGNFFDRTIVLGGWPGDATFVRAKAAANTDFQIHFADRAQKHLFHGGALHVEPGADAKGTPFDPNHPERNRPAALYHTTTQAIEKAIPLGMARWVNYFFPSGAFKTSHWNLTRDLLLSEYFPGRSSGLLAQLRNAKLYPAIDAPSISPRGGVVPYGTPLTITGPAGAAIYVGFGGVDPRLPGGALDPAAVLYTGPIPLTNGGPVKARALANGTWSALDDVEFTVEQQLHIVEIMADNVHTILDNGEADDWVEIYNGGTVPVDLLGMYLSDTAANPKKHKFTSSVVVPAVGRVLLWCDEQPSQGPNHVNVKLSKSDESVILTHTDAAGNVTLDAVTFGAQTTDVSWARVPESGAFVSLLTPTPGAPNAPGPGGALLYDATNASSSTVQMKVLSAPKLGQVLTFQVSNTGPSSPGLVFFGDSPALWFFPFEGTLLLTNPYADVSIPYVTSPAGLATPSIPVPNDPSLLGHLLCAQSYTVSGKFSNAAFFQFAP